MSSVERKTKHPGHPDHTNRSTPWRTSPSPANCHLHTASWLNIFNSTCHSNIPKCFFFFGGGRVYNVRYSNYQDLLFFFLFGKKLAKYFHFIAGGLWEPLKIMASSSASSLTDSPKAGDRALSGLLFYISGRVFKHSLTWFISTSIFKGLHYFLIIYAPFLYFSC